MAPKTAVKKKKDEGTALTLAAPAGVRRKSTYEDPEKEKELEQDKAITDTNITKFRVFSRVRPFIAEELRDMGKEGELRSIVEMMGKRTILLDPKEDWSAKSQFEFDASLWSIPPNADLVHTFADTKHDTYTTQQDVYQLVAKDCVKDAVQGYNSCILTYGQTGSGKTYTMMGEYNPESTCGGEGEEGIIPRVCNDLFDQLEKLREVEKSKPEKEQIKYCVEVNFVEIYMEKVRDLLDPAQKPRGGRGAGAGNTEGMKEGKIRQDPDCGPFVEGVTKYVVENWAHCCLLLERGSKMRTTCATVVHNQSSRSHAIFQITLLQQTKQKGKDRYSADIVKTKAGRINLVDLAGSERGGMTEYVKESSKINASLLALRRVIDNLVDRQNLLLDQARRELEGQPMTQQELDRALPQVPYRDSVLTWLLSDSIGGNAKTTMLATLSPMARNYGDTLATLQWSSKARNLVTVVKSNDIQSSIADGYQAKSEEVHGKLLIQRQNVDGIRGQLAALNTRIDDIDAESVDFKKKTVKARQDADALIELRAAWLIHLMVIRFKARREAARLQAEVDEAETTRAAAEKRRDGEQATFDAHSVAMAAKTAEAASVQGDLTAVESSLAELEKRRAKFLKKQELIKEEAEKLKAEEVQLQTKLDEKVAATEEEVKEVGVTADKTEEKAAMMKKKTEEMTKELSAAPSKEEMQKKLNEAKAKKEQKEARLKELREEKARLTKRRDELKKK